MNLPTKQKQTHRLVVSKRELGEEVDGEFRIKRYKFWDFLGGPVVKNLPAKAGDTGSIPGPGRSHMPWSN